MSDFYDQYIEKNDSLKLKPMDLGSDTPIYIILCHGIIYQDVDVSNPENIEEKIVNKTLREGVAEGIDAKDIDEDYKNVFTVPDNCLILGSTPIGTDAVVNKNADNIIVNTLKPPNERVRSLRSERDNIAEFKKLLDSKNILDWINILPKEGTNQIAQELFDETKELYFDLRPQTTTRGDGKKRAMDDQVVEPKTIGELPEKIEDPGRNLRINDHNKYENNLKMLKSFVTYEDSFKELYIGQTRDTPSQCNERTCMMFAGPGQSCIDKLLEFHDPSSDTKQNWTMGVIEISPATSRNLSSINKLNTVVSEVLPNKTIDDRKNRILNLREDIDKMFTGSDTEYPRTNLLSNRDNRAWLERRILNTIETSQNGQHHSESHNGITLKEVVNKFGKGIYLVLNCSPLIFYDENGCEISQIPQQELYSRLSNKINTLFSKNHEKWQQQHKREVSCPFAFEQGCAPSGSGSGSISRSVAQILGEPRAPDAAPAPPVVGPLIPPKGCTMMGGKRKKTKKKRKKPNKKQSKKRNNKNGKKTKRRRHKSKKKLK